MSGAPPSFTPQGNPIVSADDPSSTAVQPTLNKGSIGETFAYPKPETTLPTSLPTEVGDANGTGTNGSAHPPGPPVSVPPSAYYLKRTSSAVGESESDGAPPPALGAGGNMAPFSSTKKELLNSQISGGAKRKFR